MTGLPTLLVHLEDAAGDFTHDVTEHVHMPTGWDMRRGRNDEDDDVEVGSLDLRLDNTDGRFTLGSAMYDGITVDKRVRLTETVGATVSKRFTGYVQDWPTEWESAIGNVAVCRVKGVDRQARLNRRKLRSVFEHEILSDSPFAYYPLSEPAGSTSAGDVSGTGNGVLVMAGAGDDVVFGNSAGPSFDELTAAEFAGGKWLQGGVGPTTSGEFTLEVFFSTTSTAGGVLVEGSAGAVAIEISTAGELRALYPGGGVSGWVGSGLNDDGVHHAALRLDVFGSLDLFIDGTPTSVAGPVLDVFVDNLAAGRVPSTLAHVALFDSALADARIAAHAAAGVTGFGTDRSDERIARLAAYAGIDTADQDLETGVLTAVPGQVTDGSSTYDCMKAVVDAEGGVLFFAGDGTLTFHNRQHRVYTALGDPAVELTSGDVDHDDLTFGGAKDYLVNTATGSRSGGGEQRVVDDASVALYDEYPESLSSLLVSTDQEVLDALQWLVNNYSQPRPRLSTFTVDLLTTADQDLVEALLALELGDHVTVSGFPTHSPVATADLIVEGIKEAQSSTSWKLTFNTVPAALFLAPIYDTAGATVDTGYPVHW